MVLSSCDWWMPGTKYYWVFCYEVSFEFQFTINRLLCVIVYPSFLFYYTMSTFTVYFLMLFDLQLVPQRLPLCVGTTDKYSDVNYCFSSLFYYCLVQAIGAATICDPWDMPLKLWRWWIPNVVVPTIFCNWLPLMVLLGTVGSLQHFLSPQTSSWF